jgi:hypothetical protein
MSSSSSPSLVLELPQSWLRDAPALLLMIAALGLPWLAGSWAPMTRMQCALIGAVVAAVALWRSGFGQPAKRLSTVSWNQAHQWQLQFGVSGPITGSLLARSWISPCVLCLKFKIDGGQRYHVLLWRAQMSRHVWHQWVLRLRQEGGRTSDPAGAFGLKN